MRSSSCSRRAYAARHIHAAIAQPRTLSRNMFAWPSWIGHADLVCPGHTFLCRSHPRQSISRLTPTLLSPNHLSTLGRHPTPTDLSSDLVEAPYRFSPHASALRSTTRELAALTASIAMLNQVTVKARHGMACAVL